ncbi:riboflavin synthase subunit alpha, partial [Listeria monocytogenes]|nr:riboflavin synthase subunit alpha [Listeria monocytogenes]
QTMENLMERMDKDNRMVLIDLKTKQLAAIEMEEIE